MSLLKWNEQLRFGHSSILDLNTDISLYLWVQYLGMTFWNRSKAKYILITRGWHFKSSPSKNMWGEIAPHVLPCDKSVLLTAWAVKMSHTLSHGGFTLNVETSSCTLKVAQNEVTQRCIAWLIKIAHYFHLKIHTIYHSCFDRLPLETLTQNSMTHTRFITKKNSFEIVQNFPLRTGYFVEQNLISIKNKSQAFRVDNDGEFYPQTCEPK